VTHFERLQEKAAYAQAPSSCSVLDILEATKGGTPLASWKKEDSDIEETSPGRVTGKRKSDDEEDDTSTLITERLTLSTGDNALDKLLGVGLRRGCMTEIVGER
jgi:hypothetical protein